MRKAAARSRFPHVFVLCTGRCGSLTFAEACRAGIGNYSSGHESNLSRAGEGRLAYPQGHIEVDNRLAWFLGPLHERYGAEAFYVHLTRDPEQTARSYARRRALGFLLHAWTRGIHVGLPDDPDHLAMARELVATVNANIRLFLADKPHRMAFALESATADFVSFHQRIGAEGDLQRGLAAGTRRHNASAAPAARRPFDGPGAGSPGGPGAGTQAAPGGGAAPDVAVPAIAAAGIVPPAAGAFPADAPLPGEVRAMMDRRLPGEADPQRPSVTGRRADLVAHLESLAPDFAGEPALCRHVAELVVHVRRGIALEPAVARLFSLVEHAESGDFLARRLSLRWLVSVLDTLADHAPLQQAAGALALSVLVNTVKLAETERLLVRDPAHDPQRRAQLEADFPVHLFGGLNAFRPESGDMVANLFARLETVLMDQPFQHAALVRVREEFRRAPNLFSRLARYHPRLF